MVPLHEHSARPPKDPKMTTSSLIAVTGASGQLGRLAIQTLLVRGTPADRIVAIARDPAKVADLASRGVQVRQGDYDRPETLDAALAGVDRLLLVSSSEVGKRAPQHQAVLDAAVRAGVGLVAYTSLLHADTSPLGLAVEHVQTEQALQASDLPHVLLRNDWYTENYAAGIPGALQQGTLFGSAGTGRLSLAARADYAEAAAIVIASDDPQAGKVYELAGDDAVTLADFAAEIARQTGTPIAYQDLSQQDYRDALLAAGLPGFVAELLSDSDAGAAKGGLFDDSGTLGRLIGRPTTSMADVIAKALAG